MAQRQERLPAIAGCGPHRPRNHVGGHMLFRNEAFQFGLLGGLGGADVHEEEAWNSHIYGAEAQVYLGNATI